jgi:hypothetical protein
MYTSKCLPNISVEHLGLPNSLATEKPRLLLSRMPGHQNNCLYESVYHQIFGCLPTAKEAMQLRAITCALAFSSIDFRGQSALEEIGLLALHPGIKEVGFASPQEFAAADRVSLGSETRKVDKKVVQHYEYAGASALGMLCRFLGCHAMYEGEVGSSDDSRRLFYTIQGNNPSPLNVLPDHMRVPPNTNGTLTTLLLYHKDVHWDSIDRQNHDLNYPLVTISAAERVALCEEWLIAATAVALHPQGHHFKSFTALLTFWETTDEEWKHGTVRRGPTLGEVYRPLKVRINDRVKMSHYTSSSILPKAWIEPPDATATKYIHWGRLWNVDDGDVTNAENIIDIVSS